MWTIYSSAFWEENMKKEHTDIKLIAIAFTIGSLLTMLAYTTILKPAKLSPTAQWCIANPKYADWAKARHEKVLKAAEEVYLEK